MDVIPRSARRRYRIAEVGKASSVLSISYNDDNRVRFVSGIDKVDKVRFRTSDNELLPLLENDTY